MATPLRVLILEDSSADAELMIHELRRTGFEPRWQRVDTEKDFRAALGAALDVILSDQKLPRFDGLEALRLANESGLNIPFIIVSGAIDEESAVAFLKQGACDYVLKDRLTRLGPAVVHALENKLLRERSHQLGAALGRSEELNRQILETANDPFVSIDEAGRVLAWNAQAESIFGWPRQEALGQPLTELIIPPLYREAHQQGLQRLARKDKKDTKCRMEITARHKDAHEFPVELAIWATQVDGRHVCNAFLRDISARKQAEEALRQSEQRYRWLAENTTDIITIVDRDGQVLYGSPSSARVLGIPAEECLGKNTFELVHPEDRPGTMETFAQVAASPGSTAQKELRYRHADGSWRVLDVVAVNRLDDPIVDGILLCSRDISERRRLEEQMRQAQKMEAIGRLAGGVAHDFNNLLTVINGYSEILLGALAPATPHHELLQHIHWAGERAAAMTRQLLAFSRKQLLQPHVFDLNDLITASAKMLRRLIGEDIKLVTELDPALGTIHADPGQVDQVLLNLAVNARDAMPDGGSLTLATHDVVLEKPLLQGQDTVPPGRYAQLVVRDSGCGMTAEVLGHLFEPFFTTKEQGQGTGLGLATVLGIVQQSGGRLFVDSKPGQGTAFVLFLPVVATPEEATRHLPPVPPDQEVGQRPTVLLVEDEANVRALTRMILETRGYQVLEAAAGLEALQVAARHQGPIHLLLTDVVMPGMDGRHLADQLQPGRPEMRVLFISGYSDETLGRKGVLAEGTPLLQKPFSATILVQKVRQVLAGQDAQA